MLDPEGETGDEPDAVNSYRNLAEVDPPYDFNPAAALMQRTTLLSEAGRRDEARDACTESVNVLRHLAEADPLHKKEAAENGSARGHSTLIAYQFFGHPRLTPNSSVISPSSAAGSGASGD